MAHNLKYDLLKANRLETTKSKVTKPKGFPLNNIPGDSYNVKQSIPISPLC